MICACIDIGSNTTRLLVADVHGGRLRPVRQERAFTRLGAPAAISAAKIDEVAATVAAQVALAREHGAERLRAVATHAVREAGNREALIACVEDAAGVPVEVLSCDEEAGYAFRGATHALGDVPGRIGVADIGGGSSELVCGTAGGGVAWSTSVPIGSGSLAAQLLRSDPPRPHELAEVRQRVDLAFADAHPPKPEVALAVGGSATSLCRLVGPVLDAEALHRAVGVCCSSPSEALARRLGLHPERVRLLPAGMLLLRAASAAFGVPLQVADGGLREGVVLEVAERERAAA